MSSPFAFVPRQVTKSAKDHDPTSTLLQLERGNALDASSSGQANTAATKAIIAQDLIVQDKGKGDKHGETQTRTGGKSTYSDEDYAILLSMSLSDHALWSDPDLRRLVEWNSKAGEVSGKGGFIPLSYLLLRSPVLSGLHLEKYEVPIVKALRSCANNELEVRMLVSAPSRSNWLGKQDNASDLGGYEIRRQDWESVLQRPSMTYSRDDWEKRTLYLEHIPPQYRTISKIAHFILALLTQQASTRPSLNCVQNITLPPHHQDKPDDQPKYKGFALVTLSHTDHVDSVLRGWPWERVPESENQNKEASAEIFEAAKFGFRVLSKGRWEQLKEEYIAYGGKLLEEIIEAQDAEVTVPVPLKDAHKSRHGPSSLPSTDALSKASGPTIDLSSPYPLNCLVFVRNIHPETNKTTLRTLFSTSFKKPITNNEVQGDGLDYVDFNKGMDSCYLRLATPSHAQILVDYFAANTVLHTRGLDDTGTAENNSKAAVTMEIVQGKREELYWEKVPEKVRREAVQKAISQIQMIPNGHGEEDSSTRKACNVENGTIKWKRRKQS